MASESEAVEWVQTASGAIAIRDAICVRWRSAAGEMTPDGDDVQAHLGEPLGEQTATPLPHGGGTAQLFRRGMIVARQDGRAFVVYGALYDSYLEAGGVTSALGQPTSDEEASPGGGRVAHFENADIYWREDFGARVVRGPSRKRYATTGYPFRRSLLGRAASFFVSSVRGLGSSLKRP
jgi:hypothetical protein